MPDPRPSSDIRLPLTEGGADGAVRVKDVTPDVIRAIVEEFYAACRRDPTLGPIFERHVENWDEHLARIRAFWSSVLLGTAQFSGRPLEAHLAIPELSTEHFSLWLRLFAQIVSKHCSDADTAVFMALAGRMANVIVAHSEIRRKRDA